MEAQVQKESKTKNLPKEREGWEITYTSTGGIEVKLTPSIVRKYLVHGRSELVTDQEIVFFMNICRARGLNPLTKDVYLIKYSSSDPAAIVTSIDFFRKRARAQKDCVGWQKGIIVQGKDGIQCTNGLILQGQVLVGGWFEATPEGWKVPFRIEVNLNGYLKYRSDKENGKKELTKFWQEENQPTMIAKVAEAQGLRTLWPDEFQGLLSEEETEKEPSMGNGAIDIGQKSFDELAKEKFLGAIPKDFNLFIEETAKGQRPSIQPEDLKAEAAKDFHGFLEYYEVWKTKRQPKEEILKDENTQDEGIPTAEEEAQAFKGKGMIPDQRPLDLRGKKK